MRAFLSINLPKAINISFDEIKGVKLKEVESKNIHLTLKFLGEIAAKDAEEISNALNFIENEKKFSISLKGIGAFPNENYVKILWIGVEEGNKETCDLQKKIDDALRHKYQPEKDFIPHLTIARVKYVKDKASLNAFIEKYNDFEFLKFTAESVSLMKSELRKEGPIYSEIKAFPLMD